MTLTAVSSHTSAQHREAHAGGARSVPPAITVAACDVVILVATLARGRVGWACVAAALIGFVVAGSYRRRVAPTLLADAPGIVARLAVAASLVGAAAYSDPGTMAMLRSLPLAIGALLVGRWGTYALVRRLDSAAQRPVLIAGTGDAAVEYATTLAQHPEYGLRPIGFVDEPRGLELPLPLLGGIDDLRAVARRHECRDVIVAFGRTRAADMVRPLRACARDGFGLWVVPRLRELGVVPPGPHTLDVWGLPLLEVRTRYGAFQRLAKRSIDVAVSSVLGLLAAPLLAALAVVVKLSSPGPVLFRQRRVGQHGRPCELLKFRTMRVHDGSDTAWTEDDLVTPVGKILRKTSADELPQLWNVLLGDMSLVGPRPERPHFARGFAGSVEGYADRTRMPVGLTGWAQVNGLRGDTSIAERVRFDNRYIEHWSVGWDIAILAKTVPALLKDAFSPVVPGFRTARAGRRVVRVTASIALVALVVGIGAVAASASAPVPTTYAGPGYAAAAPPTADKPQSKLWQHDGSWWGLLEARKDRTIHVFELMATHTWRDTGTRVSPSTGRGDALADGNRVYIATRTDQRVEVTRLSYAAATRKYTVDGGFPATVTDHDVESVSIAKDSAGVLWVTYTYANRVWVAASSDGGARWSSPFNPPGDTTVSPDDISAIVAYQGHIGVMWSDQQSAAFRFAPHRDTEKTNRWESVQTPISGPGVAEDHVNLRSDGARVYAAIKTSRNDIGAPATDPIVYVLVREADASWRALQAWSVADAVTRPIALIDHTAGRLHLFATAPEAGGKIYTKSAPLATLSFPAGRGDTFMSWSGNAINNATSTKQDVTGATGIVVLASAQATKTYFHAEVPIVAPDTQAPSVPAGLVATAPSSTSVQLDWQASTDNVAVGGYRVVRDGIVVATVGTPGFRDDTVAPRTSYTYSVVAFDEAGNSSAPSAGATLTTPGPGEAGIDFRAAASGHNFDARTLEISAPPGIVPGDVLLASIDVRGNPAITAPTGWSEVHSDQNGFVARKSTYVKTVTSSEPASYTWTFTQMQSSSGVILAYAGVDGSAPIDAHGGRANAASTSISAPAITTTVDGARVVGLYATAVATSIAPPAGAIARAQAVSSEGTYDVTSGASDELVTAAGATGERTAKASLTAANIGQLIALRPQGGA